MTMPKKINRDEIRRVILSHHDKTFSYHDITRETGYSYPPCMEIMNELCDTGQIVIDHKEGRTIYYSLSGFAKENAPVIAANPMMDLSPQERFANIAALASNVIGGFSPSLMVTGLSGIGKTYLIRKQLMEAGLEEGMNYNFVTGHSSPMGLYTFLHNHRDQITVFDDCDSVFDDNVSTNLLKAALDSYDTRKLCWNSSRLPDDVESSFEFEGQILFISNRMSDTIDEAIKSRTMVINLQMSRKEIIEYMREIVDELDPRNMSIDEKLEVIDYLDDVKDSLDQLNLRTLIKISRLRHGAGDMDWRKMAACLD
jgi:hypothetical protein